MTDDDAFLAAVRASPDDAVLRLVYADWLDERDDPRGRFLRLEAEAARLGEADPAFPELQRQLAAAAAATDVVWLKAVCRVVIDTDIPVWWPFDSSPDDLPPRPAVSTFSVSEEELTRVRHEEIRIRAGGWWEYAYLFILLVWAVLVLKLVALFVAYPKLLV